MSQGSYITDLENCKNVRECYKKACEIEKGKNMTSNNRLGNSYDSFNYYQLRENKQNDRLKNNFSNNAVVYNQHQRQIVIQFSLLNLVFEVNEVSSQFKQNYNLTQIQKFRLIDQSIILFDMLVNKQNIKVLLEELDLTVESDDQFLEMVHFIMINCFYINMRNSFSDFWFSNKLVADVLDYKQFKARHVQVIQNYILEHFEWDIEIISVQDFNDVFWHGFVQIPQDEYEQQQILGYLAQIGLIIQSYLQFQKLDNYPIHLTAKEVSVITIIYMIERFRKDLLQNIHQFFKDHNFDEFFKNQINIKYSIISEYLDLHKQYYSEKMNLFKDVSETQIQQILSTLESDVYNSHSQVNPNSKSYMNKSCFSDKVLCITTQTSLNKSDNPSIYRMQSEKLPIKTSRKVKMNIQSDILYQQVLGSMKADNLDLMDKSNQPTVHEQQSASKMEIDQFHGPSHHETMVDVGDSFHGRQTSDDLSVHLESNQNEFNQVQEMEPKQQKQNKSYIQRYLVPLSTKQKKTSQSINSIKKSIKKMNGFHNTFK